MKKIKLTQGKFALVSDIDYAYLNQWKWCVARYKNNIFYAVRHTTRPNQRTIYMHRVILERMGQSGFRVTDHINRNGLDNQRKNLRPATYQQNAYNRGKPRNNTLTFKGIRKCRDKWRAVIQVKGHKISLGIYPTKIEASRAYDDAVIYYFQR